MAASTEAENASRTRFGARAVLAFLSLALVAVPFSLLLFLVEDRWRPLLRVDGGARDSLHEFAVEHEWFVTAMKTVSFFGSSRIYVPLFTAIVVWLALRRLPRLALFVAATMLGSWALNATVKVLVDRARPVLPDPVAHAGGMSFPSGHAQSAFVAASVLLLVFLPVLHGRRPVALAGAVVWVLLVGFSRVALGVHFVSDVLAAYVLGAAWVGLMTAAFGAWRRERGLPPVELSEGLEPEHAQRLTADDAMAATSVTGSGGAGGTPPRSPR
jgi:undecaprenyl-diphosphatase